MRDRQRRNWLTVVGAVLVLASSLVAAYVVWEIYGTTWFSHRKQADIVRDVKQAWADPGAETAGGNAGSVSVPAGERDCAPS